MDVIGTKPAVLAGPGGTRVGRCDGRDCCIWPGKLAADFLLALSFTGK